MDARPEGFDLLVAVFKKRTGIDLSAYKERQMIRRLTSYLRRVDAPSFAVLASRIARDDAALQHLKDYITINVSEFFRNPDRYEALEREILPALFQEFGTLRIWSAGCSIGAEPYSLSILLEELDPKTPHRILATDVDVKALEVAKAGIYNEDKLKEVSSQRLRRFFTREEADKWRVAPEIKRRVRFQVHDLLKDPYPVGQHLILCRNVVIYFVDEAKEEVFRKLAEALVEGGYLMIGSTESIFRPERYGLQAVGSFVYRKMKKGGVLGVARDRAFSPSSAGRFEAGGRSFIGAGREAF